MNKGGNSCKSYLKWPQKQVYCCFKIKLKLLMIVLFLFVYIHTCIRIRKYFLYNIAVLYHSFTHSIYLYICFAKTISISFMACLLPGVNSAISVGDEWTFISQYVCSELQIGQRSKLQIILVIVCILNYLHIRRYTT